jgi:hypothetical protein
MMIATLFLAFSQGGQQQSETVQQRDRLAARAAVAPTRRLMTLRRVPGFPLSFSGDPHPPTVFCIHRSGVAQCAGGGGSQITAHSLRLEV